MNFRLLHLSEAMKQVLNTSTVDSDDQDLVQPFAKYLSDLGDGQAFERKNARVHPGNNFMSWLRCYESGPCSYKGVPEPLCAACWEYTQFEYLRGFSTVGTTGKYCSYWIHLTAMKKRLIDDFFIRTHPEAKRNLSGITERGSMESGFKGFFSETHLDFSLA
jgi:hypothetical protein